MQLLISTQSISRTGKITKSNFRKCNTLLSNYLAFLFIQMSQSNLSLKDTSNTSRTITPASQNLSLNASAADANWGIQLGTSAQAVVLSDYKLITPILHGSTSGKLYYEAVTFPTGFVISGSDVYFDVRRNIINNSGADITYNEIGLTQRNVSNYYHIFDRTLENFTIVNTEGRIIIYRFQKSY